MSNQPEPAPARSTASRRAGRGLVKGLEASAEVCWALDANRQLIYINRAGLAWLGLEDDSLFGHVCHPGAPIDSPLAALAICLAPPAGLLPGAEAVVEVTSPGGQSRQVRFLRWGEPPGGMYLAWGSGLAGAGVADADQSLEAWRASWLRSWLSTWRRQRHDWAGAITAGASSIAIRLRGQVLVAAATRQHIAINGPRGSGGEMIARRIHSRMADGGQDPLVVVDMPLMDAELLEATLSPAVAHLSGPTPRRVTLLLRGVDESPLEIQSAVLAFASRWGGAVRLIGLFRGAVASAVVAGEVTSAMGLAMSVFEIPIEPLAARVEDLALIAAALVDHRHATGQGVGERFSRSALDRLLLYPWPDNYEELDAAIRHAVSVSRSAVIGEQDLPLVIRTYVARSTPAGEQVVADLDQALRSFELDQIVKALRCSGGNRSAAAKRLGISRVRLIRRLAANENDGTERS